MKISTASKKVLASALSAAMVVAFAPTVAFGADLGGTTGTTDLGESAVEVTYVEKGVTKVEKFSTVVTAGDYNNGIQGAFDFAAVKGGTVKLLGDIAADVMVNGKVTIDLNGHTWSNPGNDQSAATPVTGMDGAPITVNTAVDTPAVTYTTYLNMTQYKGTGKAFSKASLADVVAAYNAANSTDVTEATITGEQILTVVKPLNNVALGGIVLAKDGNYYKCEAEADKAELNDVDGIYAAVRISGTEITLTPAKKLAAGDVTIKDSSEAKTGKVDGNSSDKDAQGKETQYATETVDILTGGALTIEGGTFTTGNENAVYAYSTGISTLKAIDGAVASMKNATVEVYGGSVYADDTTSCTVTKPVAVEAVTVNGDVKDSKVIAVAGDATEKVNAHSTDHVFAASATALTAKGNVESTVVEATAGKTGKDASASSTAIAIDATGAAADKTYKKVTATATANGINESKETSTTSAAVTAIAVKAGTTNKMTIWSGKYTGERVNGPVLQGGEYSKHIASSEIGGNFATVCLGVGKSDFVFKKLAATVTGDLADGDATAYGTAVTTAANNAIRDAIASASNYKVGTVYAEGYDAAALAAAATDYAVSKDLALKADVQAASAAKAVATGETPTDEKVAFNEAVAAVDAAAKEAGKVAFSYVNATAGIVYNDPAKAAVRGYKGTPVLSLTDLGVTEGNADVSGDSHATTTTPTLVANAYGYEAALLKSDLISGTAKDGLTTKTKTAATANTFGTAFEEVAASKVGNDTDFFTTKLGTLAVLSTNAGQVEENVDPETPAVEKATQSISVDQKSLTVKLGAKKTKTAKGKSFAMGASAETELTTAWKSGSSKITVSGDKVKLAKGAKRGTYTAKVSLKAAASDAYLTAAKTITVKFVIK